MKTGRCSFRALQERAARAESELASIKTREAFPGWRMGVACLGACDNATEGQWNAANMDGSGNPNDHAAVLATMSKSCALREVMRGAACAGLCVAIWCFLRMVSAYLM